MIKFTKYLLVILCLCANVNVFAQRDAKLLELTKIPTTLQLIDQFYVDEVNTGELVEKAIINILKELDPHSAYISQKEFEAMNAPLMGNFEGIGIEFNIFEDTLMVVNPLIGGPSEKVGILSNDRIVEADGKSIVGITNDNVFKLLRGKKGSKIKLGIKRRGVSEILKFTVVRDKIPFNSLDATYLVKPNMLYMKLGRFATTSTNEIKEAYKKYENDSITSLILDLRSNGGGVLDAAEEISDQFFDEGNLLVYTEDRRKEKSATISTADGIFKNTKVVVLVNEYSASASEIVSGAIQDWDRGILIGRRTFGKGLVQTQIPYRDGSFLRLTVSRYHTPTGRVIQRPYNKGDLKDYYQDIFKRYEKNGEVYTNNVEFPDSLKYKTLKNGRTVFGGGGIMPDIFIPMDTSNYSKYASQIYQKGILMQFLIPFMEKYKKDYKAKYPDFETYLNDFELDSKTFKSFVKYAEKEGVKKDEKGLKTSGDELKLVLKALIARDLFSYSEYYQILNDGNDTEYKKAIEVLDNWDKFEKEILNPNVK